MNRLRLYVDLRPDCPTSHFNLTSESDRLEYWESRDVDGDIPPANTFPTCSNGNDNFDLRYLKFTLKADGGLNNRAKQVIWLELGMHGGHESSNQMTVLFFVQTLFQNIDDPWVRSLLSKYIFVIFPSVNVYGNFYDPECMPGYTNANNVNLLYNFGYDFFPSSHILSTHWNNARPWPDWALGAREHNDAKKPFSEPESRIIRNVIVKMCHPVLGEGYKLAGLVDWHNNGNNYLWVDPNGAMDGATAMYNGVVPEFARDFSRQYADMKSYFDSEINARWNINNIIKDASSPTTSFVRTLAGIGIVIAANDTITPDRPKTISVNEGDIRAFRKGGGNGEYPLQIDDEQFDFEVPSEAGHEIRLVNRGLKGTSTQNHSANARIQYAGFPLTTQRTVKFPSNETISVDWFSEIFKVNALYMEPPALWRFGVKEGTQEANTELMYINFIFGQVAYLQAIAGSQLGPTLEWPAANQVDVGRRSIIWRSVPGADRYHVQVATDSLFESLVFSDSMLADTVTTVPGISSRGVYHWRAQALFSTGGSGWSMVRRFETGAFPPLEGHPSNGETLAAERPYCEWDSISPTARYEFQLSQDSTFASLLVLQDNIAVTELSVQGIGLIPQRKYYWRVRTKDSTYTSEWSKVWNFVTVNSAPAITSLPDTTTGEDSLYEYDLDVADSDSALFHDHMQYSLITDASWLHLDTLDGIISGTPRGEDVGQANVSIVVADAFGASVSQSFAIHISHTNHSPSLDSTRIFEFREDSLSTVRILAFDRDTQLFGDTLIYSLQAAPSWLSLDSLTGQLTGRPGALDVGDTSVIVSVNDGRGGNASRSYPLRVLHVNHCPELLSITDTLAIEDTLFTSYLKAVDQDTLLFGDRISYRLTSSPSWLAVDSLTGRVSGIASGRSAVDTTLLAMAVDAGGLTSARTFYLKVRHTNHPPQIVSAAPLSANEDSLYSYAVVASDVDSTMHADTIRFSATVKPSWVSIDSVSGVLRGVPSARNVGDTIVVLTASDGHGGLARQEFALSVSHTNHRPFFTSLPDTLAIEDSVFLSRVTAADQDTVLFGDRIRFRGVIIPSWVRLDTMTGSITGTPIGRSAVDTLLSIEVLDRDNASSRLNVPLRVRHTNHPPVVTSIPVITAQEDSLYRYRVQLHDVDIEMFGDSLRASVVSKPNWMTFDSSTFQLRGIPAAVNVGDTVVSIRVEDGKGGAIVHSFSLTVAHTNHPPVIVSNPSRNIAEDSSYVYSVRLNDPDAELFGDTLILHAQVKPSWLRFDSTSSRLFGIPTGLNVGDTNVALHVTDGRGGAATQSFALTVSHTNHLPIFVSTPALLAIEDTLYEYLAIARDQDTLLFGDQVRYSLVNKPSWLEIDSLTGLVRGTATIHNLQDTVVAILARDGMGGETRQEYELALQHTNHQPSIISQPLNGAIEDSLYVYDVVATDVDSLVGDRIRYSLIARPSWLQIDSLSGRIFGIPPATSVGDTNAKVRVEDYAGLVAIQSYPLSVTHTNHPPVFTTVPIEHAVEDSVYEYEVRAVDSDATLFGDTLTFSFVVKPSWLSLDSKSGLVTGTPHMNDLNDSVVVIEANDGRGGKTTQSYSIRMQHTNHSPRFVIDEPIRQKTVAVFAVEDNVFRYTSHAIDIDTPLFGDSVWYIAGAQPSWLDLDAGTGMISGTPENGDVDTLLHIYATDGSLADTLTLSIRVMPVNDQPSITQVPDITISEDSSTTISLAEFLADPDNLVSELAVSLDLISRQTNLLIREVPAPRNPLEMKSKSRTSMARYKLSSGGDDSLMIGVDSSGRTLNVASSKNFYCSPLPMVLTVRDPDGLAASDTILITVAPQNDPPRLSGLPPVTVSEDDSLTIGLSHFRQFVTDPDDQFEDLQWTFSPPVNARIERRDTAIVIIPSQNWFGQTATTVYVVDHAGEKDSSAFQINVSPVNDTPKVDNIPELIVTEDSSLRIDLDQFAFDVDNDSSQLNWSVWLKDSSLVHRPVDKATGKSSNQQFGEDSLRFWIDRDSHVFTVDASSNYWLRGAALIFSVTDPDGQRSADTVRLEVSPINDAPVLHALHQIIITEDDSLGLTIAELQKCVADPDNEPAEHRWEISGSNSIITRQVAGSFVFVPQPNWNGHDTLDVIVFDLEGASDTTSLEIVVTGANDAPAMSGMPDTLAFFGTRYEYIPTVIDADSMYGDKIHFSLTSAPKWLTIDSVTGRVYGIAPRASSIERYQIGIHAADLSGSSSTVTFSLVASEKIGNGLDGTIPEAFTLKQNYPNPFNPQTRIIYGLPQPAFVRIEVFGILGQHIITLVEADQNAGYYAAEWNGTDSQGSGVASGIYFYRVSFQSENRDILSTFTKKMALLK